MDNYIQARQSQLNYYRTTPLFYQGKDKNYALYKPSGIRLSEMRIEHKILPEKLYIRKHQKLNAIREVQKVFNEQLKEDLKKEDKIKVRDTILYLVDETFTEPRSGSIEGLSTTVSIIANKIIEQPDVIKNFAMLSFKDYTTALHSVNVMALAFSYGISENFSKTDLKSLALSALLHDVGKLRVPIELLSAPRSLSDKEFNEIKLHPKAGYNLLLRCKFGNQEVEQAALFHHERINGQGYPDGIKRIPEFSQIIGMIDCYEALTNDDRPYRDALSPYKALSLVKKEVVDGNFKKTLFEKLVYSLV